MSVMLANNETGVVFDVATIARLVKKEHPGLLVHTDAAQALGESLILQTDVAQASGETVCH